MANENETVEQSRSNTNKPFYVDVETSVAAVRCQSNDDVIVCMGKCSTHTALAMCDRMNAEVDKFVAAKDREIAEKMKIIDGLVKEWSKRDALIKELADTLDEDNKTECEQWCKCSCQHGDDKNGCEMMCKKRALVKKARKVCK